MTGKKVDVYFQETTVLASNQTHKAGPIVSE